MLAFLLRVAEKIRFARRDKNLIFMILTLVEKRLI